MDKSLKLLKMKQDASSKLLLKLRSKFSEEDLKKIADSGHLVSAEHRNTKLDFSGTSVKFLVMSDTHIGSKYDNLSGIEQAIKQGIKSGCDILLHAGDVVDGDGLDKKGYVHDLRVIGYDNQRAEAHNVFKTWEKPSYFISGNHDLHAYLSAGHDVVKAFCGVSDNDDLGRGKWGRNYIGKGGGVLSIKKSNIELFHGADSASGYAYSYRVQQIVRAITGGYKPNILITGHDHKMLYVMSRMIHCLGAGALSYRSRWMKDKRLEHHQGFWNLTVWFDRNGGVATILPQAFPIYK